MKTDRPFNALHDPRLHQKFSENKWAERLVGKRNLRRGVTPIDLPCELGFHCPVCKYEHEIDGTFDERLTWSEYNGFLYCYVCNKDYPSALCMPNIDEAINIYLDSIEFLFDGRKDIP